MRAIIFDTETTGLLLPSCVPLDEQPHIIEIGAVKTDGERIISMLTQLINPGIEISQVITKITGICDDDVKQSPSFEKFLPELKDFFSDADVVIAHNAHFDTCMLNLELKRAEEETFLPDHIVCSVQEYKAAFGKRPSLKVLYRSVIGKELQQTHRALDDAKALYDVLKHDRFFDKIK